ncbi:MAG: TIGR02206 family membrane protein [Lachnospiraceae bacterium]
MRNFFSFQTDYPAGSGFSLFGFQHILWLVMIIIVCAVSTRWYLNLEDIKQKRASVILGSFLPIMGMYRDVVLIITGHFNKEFLPFHLCSMALWIGALYVLTNNSFIGITYLLLCVPGAISALLFPDWSMYPFLNYMHIHAFLSHGCIVCLGSWLFFSGRIHPTWKDLWIPVLFGLIGVIVIYPINRMLGTNYWFINSPSFGSPLMMISHLFGDGWYLFGFLLFSFFMIIIWLEILSLVYHLKEK